ncbi:glycine-rich cell wall structural protein 1.0-like [Miscanthus floridulus]|uniref:glycine-rich cell wall structural protein 1.0-like n=1 Tax=Miscanthus floridulus TaxID=154761 RepID=UPI0034596EF5
MMRRRRAWAGRRGPGVGRREPASSARGGRPGAGGQVRDRWRLKAPRSLVASAPLETLGWVRGRGRGCGEMRGDGGGRRVPGAGPLEASLTGGVAALETLGRVRGRGRGRGRGCREIHGNGARGYGEGACDGVGGEGVRAGVGGAA